MEQHFTAAFMVEKPRPEMETISLDKFCALMEEGQVLEKSDLGCVAVYRVEHPTHGRISLVNTTADRHAVIYS